jgi:hypothetical protein
MTGMDDMAKKEYGLSQWKLVRSAIEHENTLINYRISWLLATQLFLFAVFSSIFVEAIKNEKLFMSTKVYIAFAIITSIGFYVCILALASLCAAQKMINRLRDWWLVHYSEYDKDEVAWINSIKLFKDESKFPPVNGIFTENLHEWFNVERLPSAIAACWLLLLALTSSIFAKIRHKVDIPHILIAVIAFISIGFLLLNHRFRPLLKEDNHKLNNELVEIHKKLAQKQ